MSDDDFWKNVDMGSTSECWLWKKARNVGGYGI